ncbi:hypothetical protein BPY_16550 [Bifidobacterium psychraerophilum]
MLKHHIGALHGQRVHLLRIDKPDYFGRSAVRMGIQCVQYGESLRSDTHVGFAQTFAP